MPEYAYTSASPDHTHRYLMPGVTRLLARFSPSRRLFELGCGAGAVANDLSVAGFEVTAIDLSESGIAQAKQAYANVRFEVGSAYDDLASRFGAFDTVLSLEVVEHLYSPRDYARAVRNLLQPGGVAIISTPYHSYLKNLALAASGKMDAHFTALWDGGHIKFWSRKTLAALFAEVDMVEVDFLRVGRIPSLAMSMIQVFKRTES